MKGVKIPALGNTLILLMIDYSSLWQIQIEAARIATGTTKLVSIENLNKNVTKINLRVISKCHVHLQSLTKTPVKFQKDWDKIVGGVALTKYPLK